MKNKFLKPALALVLLTTMTVGGSLAYINAQTDEIENKFVYAHVGDGDDTLAIELDETFTLGGDDVSEMEDGIAKFLPGDEIVKSPVVTVTANALEDGAYVFIEIKGDGADNIVALGFTVDTDVWTAVSDTTNVYYTVVDKITDSQLLNFDVFSTDTITIPTDFSDSTFDEVQTLTVDAYAIQKANLDSAEDAWLALNPSV
ncbi:MAG: hypothetical protein R3Y57_00215 [Erysipelotrichaceae bacterium]